MDLHGPVYGPWRNILFGVCTGVERGGGGGVKQTGRPRPTLIFIREKMLTLELYNAIA